jgi:hypothetical protein
MSNEKQTAIEWLGNEITNRITRRNPHDTIIIQILGETLIELIEQAKEKEKGQHANTWDDSRVEDKGDNYIGKQKSFNDYYEQTYGGKK